MVSKSHNNITAQAPGSLMIMGEHAVLHGSPAIVAAINKYLNITLEVTEKVKDFSGIIICTQMGSKDITYAENLENINISGDLDYILAVINYFKKDLLKLNLDYKFIITSDIPHTMGLGSSAAIVAAGLLVINQLLDNKYSKIDLFKIGRNIIRNIQGGGSGSDLAASLYSDNKNKVFWYEVDKNNIEAISDYLPLDIIYSGYKLSTKEVISKMHNQNCIDSMDKIDINKNYAKEIYNNIKNIVIEAKDLIISKNWKKLGGLFNKHYLLQKELNTSDNNIEYIVSQLNNKEDIFGAKISGSGLGDCIISLSDKKSDLNNIKYLHKNGQWLKNIEVA